MIFPEGLVSVLQLEERCRVLATKCKLVDELLKVDDLGSSYLPWDLQPVALSTHECLSERNGQPSLRFKLVEGLTNYFLDHYLQTHVDKLRLVSNNQEILKVNKEFLRYSDDYFAGPISIRDMKQIKAVLIGPCYSRSNCFAYIDKSYWFVSLNPNISHEFKIDKNAETSFLTNLAANFGGALLCIKLDKLPTMVDFEPLLPRAQTRNTVSEEKYATKLIVSYLDNLLDKEQPLPVKQKIFEWVRNNNDVCLSGKAQGRVWNELTGIQRFKKLTLSGRPNTKLR